MKTKIIAAIAVLFLFLTVKASRDAYLSKKLTAPSPSTKSLAVLTKNLEYDFNRPSVRNEYYSNLDQLASSIIDNNYAVSLRGHADSIGKYKYNWVLSDKRAIGVKDYLVSKGVKTERIITTPFGSTVPIATNKTASGRQKNRRVEIELKKISE